MKISNLRDLSGIAWNMNMSELVYFIEKEEVTGEICTTIKVIQNI